MDPAMRNIEMREQGLCFIEREQKELKRLEIKTKDEKGKDKIEIRYETKNRYFVSHKNDRTDRDICTECGNKILHGTIDRKLPDIIN